MATFPSGVKTFTTKVNNDIIEPAHVNDMQDEITAVETALRTGIFPTGVNSSALPVWVGYTPVWTTSGSAPTLGNALLSGTYLQIGKLVHYTISFSYGSGSSPGTGQWRFTLPVTSASAGYAAGSGALVDVSVGNYGVVAYLASTTTVAPYNTDVVSTGVTGTVPFTWVAGDLLQLSGFYPAV